MFKVGDKVTINPNWDKSKGNYGIVNWKKYVGREFIIDDTSIDNTSSESYCLEGLPYWFPGYMLMPMNNTIRGKLMKGK